MLPIDLDNIERMRMTKEYVAKRYGRDSPQKRPLNGGERINGRYMNRWLPTQPEQYGVGSQTELDGTVVCVVYFMSSSS